MAKYTELKNCLCCSSEKLMSLLDLNEQPLANSYHKGEELEKYPLKTNLCLECYHVQLSIAVDPAPQKRLEIIVIGLQNMYMQTI